jgi:hypothetical protein
MKIPLTKRKSAIVDAAGFAYLSQFKWYYDGSYAARDSQINGKRAKVYMHRIILNAQPGQYCDHINGDGLDNRRCNLRFCTKSQNGMNQGKQKNNTSGFKGVYWHKKNQKWIAYITLDYQPIHIGSYSTAKEAAKAYDDKALELFGEFAYVDTSRTA